MQMKKWIVIYLLIAGMAVKAQKADYNTWEAATYAYANESPGIKTIKETPAIVAFNENAVAFYSAKTGLVVFNYQTVPNDPSDTSANVVMWKGMSLATKYDEYGKYVIKFKYGKYFEIQQTTGSFWYIRMEPIKKVNLSYESVLNKK